MPDARRSASGVLYAGGAFLIWGLGPVYWKAMQAVPATEIIAHRVVWSFAFLAVLTLLQRRTAEFRSAFRPRILGILLVTSILVSSNWLIYIWAIHHGYLLQASLGYYVTPLINVLLGVVFLKERLTRPQTIAVLLAFAAVTARTVSLGEFPWIALTLGFSFGLYGLIRKVAPVSSLVGLTLETLLLTGPAVGYIGYLHHEGAAALFHVSGAMDALLIGTGVFTAVPLLFFNLGARRLHLSTVGLMQYIAPSCMFLLAVLAYGEPFSAAQALVFVLIWAALAMYSVDSIRAYRRTIA